MTLARFNSRFAFITMLLLLGPLFPALNASPIEQHRIEAAMTLQLLTFTEWPEPTPNQPIRIGILENQPFLKEIRALLANEHYKGKFRVKAIAFKDPKEVFDGIDALFFSKGDVQEVARTIKRVEQQPVALIGSFDGFLEIGGMVNFTVLQKRIGFEIHIKHARSHKIEFRAKLLRIASRILEE